MQTALYILAGFLALLTAVQWWRIIYYRRIGAQLAAAAAPLSARPDAPDRRILILGDSLWAGVGAQDIEDSLAGRLIADLPAALVVNQAESGAKIAAGIDQLDAAVAEHGEFDQIIIQLGANDILRLSPLARTTGELTALLNRAHEVAPDVAYMVCGSVGFVPLFLQPVDWFYTAMTRRYLKRLYAVATDTGTLYIDFFRERAEDPFYQNPGKYYAADKFHPSGAGYGIWYEKCRGNLQCFAYDQKPPETIEEITTKS